MIIRTPTDLGAVIRDYRRRQGLDQRALASKVGVSRQWLIEVEKGKPRAEVGLTLRTLEALGLVLSIAETPSENAKETVAAVDIDEIVRRARRLDR